MKRASNHGRAHEGLNEGDDEDHQREEEQNSRRIVEEKSDGLAQVGLRRESEPAESDQFRHPLDRGMKQHPER